MNFMGMKSQLSNILLASALLGGSPVVGETKKKKSKTPLTKLQKNKRAKAKAARSQRKRK